MSNIYYFGYDYMINSKFIDKEENTINKDITKGENEEIIRTVDIVSEDNDCCCCCYWTFSLCCLKCKYSN